MSKFKEIIQGDTPVLIDFFAEWCGPCQMMSPILKEVKNALKDEVIILKVDIDKNRSLAAQHHVRGVPTFALFHKGQLLWRQSGMLYKEDLISTIQGHIRVG